MLREEVKEGADEETNREAVALAARLQLSVTRTSIKLQCVKASLHSKVLDLTLR